MAKVRRLLSLPGIPFFLIAEGCCFVVMFFRWLGGVGTERIGVNWKHPYL